MVRGARTGAGVIVVPVGRVDRLFMGKSMRRRSTVFSRFLLTIGLALCVMNASAQAPYPSRPLKLIVPFAPGQVTDWLARMLGEQMSAELGQPVIVENRAGANGTIGTAFAVTQPADGYTLVVTSNGTHAAAPSLFKKLGYDPIGNFTHITGLMSLPWMLMVRPDFPARTINEFITYGRANPGKLTVGYGSSSSRLAIHLLRTMGKLDIVEVAYKGLGQTITDVRGGSLQFTFLDMGSAMSQERGASLRGLAVTSPKRSPVAPDKPAMAEVLPGYQMVSWLGLAFPAGAPPEAVSRIHSVVTAILGRPDIRDKIAAYGGEPMMANGAQIIEAINAETPLWARFAKEAGVEPE
jgi:tripartite-type tricarboxylate transporter receptor subunit TctC